VDSLLPTSAIAITTAKFFSYRKYPREARGRSNEGRNCGVGIGPGPSKEINFKGGYWGVGIGPGPPKQTNLEDQFSGSGAGPSPSETANFRVGQLGGSGAGPGPSNDLTGGNCGSGAGPLPANALALNPLTKIVSRIVRSNDLEIKIFIFFPFNWIECFWE
jgi:hypothetical protein